MQCKNRFHIMKSAYYFHPHANMMLIDYMHNMQLLYAIFCQCCLEVNVNFFIRKSLLYVLCMLMILNISVNC